MNGQSTFKRGDRVLMPWGLDDVVGEVDDVFGPSADPFVRVRVEVPDSTETVEIPIKMSALRAAPAGSITVSSVTSVDGRLVAQVDVDDGRGDGTRQVRITAGAEESRLLDKLLGPEGAIAALARFATHMVASMIEDDAELRDYRMSSADARYLIARAVDYSGS